METLGALSKLGLRAQLLLLGEDRFSPVSAGVPGPGVPAPAGMWCPAQREPHSASVLGPAFLAQGAEAAISETALKLSGVQVSTAPTSSFPLFPPTGTGMLMAPLWWVQLSLGNMIRECWAGAPLPLGDGLLPVPILVLWLLVGKHRT